MYTKLIDTVSNIVNTYGIGILSDNKFWSILTDSYNFSSDYILRDEFKKCIADGSVSSIISMHGDRENTLSLIRSIVKSSKHKDEAIVCLFSIAISIGSCSFADFKDFSLSTPKKPSTSNNRPNNYYPNNTPPAPKNKSKLGIRTAICWGLAVIILSGVSYGLFLIGLPTFFFLFILFILQLSYCGKLLRVIQSGNSKQYVDELVSYVLPILIFFTIFDIFPLFTTSEVWLFFTGNYGITSLPGFSRTTSSFFDAVPDVNFGMFFGVLILLFCVISCTLGIISKEFSFKRISFTLSLRKFSITSVIILCIVFVTLLPFNQFNNHRKFEYIEHMNSIEKENQRLHAERDNMVKNLSFKGISLGINFDTCLGYTDSIIEPNSKQMGYYSAKLGKSQNPFNLTYETYRNSPSPKDNCLVGQYVSGETYLDNQKVVFSVYEYNSVVSVITIKVEKYYDSSQYFDSLLDIYSRKYGQPEKYIWAPHIKYFNDYLKRGNPNGWTYFQWSFNNGAIQLSPSQITYVSRPIQELVLESFLISENKKKQLEISRNIEQHRQDSLKREQRRQDSLTKELNHQNAINEI